VFVKKDYFYIMNNALLDAPLVHSLKVKFVYPVLKDVFLVFLNLLVNFALLATISKTMTFVIAIIIYFLFKVHVFLLALMDFIQTSQHLDATNAILIVLLVIIILLDVSLVNLGLLFNQIILAKAIVLLINSITNKLFLVPLVPLIV
jgi:hypothetical protein